MCTRMKGKIETKRSVFDVCLKNFTHFSQDNEKYYLDKSANQKCPLEEVLLRSNWEKKAKNKLRKFVSCNCNYCSQRQY